MAVCMGTKAVKRFDCSLNGVFFAKDFNRRPFPFGKGLRAEMPLNTEGIFSAFIVFFFNP
jgi:hypothetical protein